MVGKGLKERGFDRLAVLAGGGGCGCGRGGRLVVVGTIGVGAVGGGGRRRSHIYRCSLGRLRLRSSLCVCRYIVCQCLHVRWNVRQMCEHFMFISVGASLVVVHFLLFVSFVCAHLSSSLSLPISLSHTPPLSYLLNLHPHKSSLYLPLLRPLPRPLAPILLLRRLQGPERRHSQHNIRHP